MGLDHRMIHSKDLLSKGATSRMDTASPVGALLDDKDPDPKSGDTQEGVRRTGTD